MIAFRGFVKRFGASVAVDGLSVEIARGEVVALLGPERIGEDDEHQGGGGARPPDGRRRADRRSTRAGVTRRTPAA